MARDNAEGNNFDAVLKTTLGFPFVSKLFDSAHGGDSGAAIRAMGNLAVSQGTLEKMDQGRPPTIAFDA